MTESNNPAKFVQAHSLRVEAALRHAFLADLYSCVWEIDPSLPLQVYQADTDDMGFDLVLSLGDTIRHVQLKGSFVGSTTRSVKIRDSLTRLKGGCVVWCLYNASNLRIQQYRFLGYASDREQLDLSLFKQAKQTRGNRLGIKKFRPGMRDIPKSTFHDHLRIVDLAYVMFGLNQRRHT